MRPSSHSTYAPSVTSTVPRSAPRSGEPVPDGVASWARSRTSSRLGGVASCVLIRRGATRVYALDVGRGLLHWRLRQDPRVVVIERVNARAMETFPEPVSLVVVDVSFIGLEKVLPAVTRAAPGAEIVALFKPQFQVERASVGKGGIVRDQEAVKSAMLRLRDWCAANRVEVMAEAPSEVAGADGNQEIFVHLRPVAG